MKQKNLVLFATIALSACTLPVNSQEQGLHERMLHSRAVEAAVWAMPIMNFKFYQGRSHRGRCRTE